MIKSNKPYKIYGENIEQGALDQFQETMDQECTIQGALLADSHQGYTLPIGCVWKTKEMIFPAAVGYDIGCGMCAVKVNAHKEELDLELLKNYIIENIPVGFNKRKEIGIVPWHNDMSETLMENIRKTGVYQIGTLGGGNHFIELGEADFDPEVDQSGEIWIVIHSGSRGVGHKTADMYMKLAASENIDTEEIEHQFFMKHQDLFKYNEGKYHEMVNKHIEKARLQSAKDIEGHHGFNINSDIGKAYLADMDYCLEYALDNRKLMISHILTGIFQQVGVRSHGEIINRNHNHAEVDEDGYVIHRKGATHAEDGMMGVIPGNMRDGSFIVRGKGNEESMNSSSHGAGRVLSRKKAKETLNLDEFRELNATLVTNHTDEMLDEAPGAYKDIFEVMELQKDLVTVVDRCRPFLNIKG